jgi:psp operon transcriptional activator
MAFELDLAEIPQFSTTAQKSLRRYDWPGNIRELKNVVERAVYRHESGLIETIGFDPFASPFAVKTPYEKETHKRSEPESNQQADQLNLSEAVWNLKVGLLEKAMTKVNYNQTEAARILGLSYHQFRGLYRKYKAWQADKDD